MDSVFSKQEQTILRTLAYFDVFDYPLTTLQLGELVLDGESEPCDFFDLLNSPMLQTVLEQRGEWVFLRGRDRCVSQRIEQARRAEPLLQQASRAVNDLYRLPFIRGIYLSGDLSKGVAGENSDIDFFIITATNRLYIAKLFLAIYRRIPRLNPKRLLCFNYLLSETSLQIGPRDRYIASEIACLAVAHNPGLLQRFLQENSWVRDFYPGYLRFSRISLDSPKRLTRLQQWLELPLRTPLGTLLDRLLWLIWRMVWLVRYRRDRRRQILLIAGTQKERCKAHSDATHFRTLAAFRKRLQHIGLEE